MMTGAPADVEREQVPHFRQSIEESAILRITYRNGTMVQGRYRLSGRRDSGQPIAHVARSLLLHLQYLSVHSGCGEGMPSEDSAGFV